MGQLHIFVGNYGSGKTELSLNKACQLRGQGKPVTLVDLDIVNPYFRSSEHRGMLENRGVRVITPTFAQTAVDIPALPAEVASVFSRDDEIIFDVGGDEIGARALGRYYPWLSKAEKTVYMVINIRRPFSTTPEKLYQLQQAIEKQSRLKIDAYINNANLSDETASGDLLEGEQILSRLCELSGVHKRFLSGKEKILQKLPEIGTEKWTIKTYTRPDWLE